MKAKITTIFLLFSTFAFAQQDISDATALFARTGINGTARTVGSGGAYGSVGADLGCININPAGLGVYRSTDFSITPMLVVGSNESVYDGNHTIVHKPFFYFNQGGFVFTKVYKNADANNPSDMGFSDHPLKSISVALNFQQTNSFDRNQNYSVNNTNNSILDGYANVLNYGQINVNNAPYEIQAFNLLNLLGFNPSTNLYYSEIKGAVSQAGDINTRGAINRIDFGLAANLKDKLYLGINLAVPIINYNLTNDFDEVPQNSPVSDYSLSTITSETGYGFNGIVGIIYRPVTFMRIGAAYHLPTWYSMNENYQLTFNEDTAGNSYSNTGQPFQPPAFKYGLRLPMKGTFSASFYYKQYGFISVDYELQNLGSTLVHVPNDSLQAEPYYNQAIKSTYGYNHTIHAGLEAAIKIVRLRAGYYWSSSPFKKGQEFTPGYTDARMAFTAGLGIRLQHFYVDLAYVYGWSKDASNQLTNYVGTSPNNVNSMYNTSNLLLTVGWKFEAGDKSKSNTRQRQQTQPQQQPRYTPPPSDGDPRY